MTNFFARFYAVHFRHIDVEQHEIRLKILAAGYGLLARCGSVDLESGSSHCLLQKQQGAGVVINDEGAGRLAVARRRRAGVRCLSSFKHGFPAQWIALAIIAIAARPQAAQGHRNTRKKLEKRGAVRSLASNHSGTKRGRIEDSPARETKGNSPALVADPHKLFLTFVDQQYVSNARQKHAPLTTRCGGLVAEEYGGLNRAAQGAGVKALVIGHLAHVKRQDFL